MGMKPGKRPGGRSSNAPRAGGGSNGSEYASSSSSYFFPKHWDTTRVSTKLHRCILTHDAFHILNWHTPAYSLFVLASIVSTLIGISSFPSLLQYLCALICSGVLLVGGVAKSLQVESGPAAVISPLEMKVRTKSVVEFNLKNLFARWIEPVLDFSVAKNKDGGSKTVAESLVNPKKMDARDLKIFCGAFVLVSIVAELGQIGREYVTISGILIFFVTSLFVIGGVKKLLIR